MARSCLLKITVSRTGIPRLRKVLFETWNASGGDEEGLSCFGLLAAKGVVPPHRDLKELLTVQIWLYPGYGGV